ncbi:MULTISPECIES: hypothetical protein [unclassified Pseudomonas]|uniref:hypothetical protein n=1 Tax=Pseudomonas sp. LBUM920 TaxID=2126069 RepID=UPI000F56B4DC|nr:hypothetical protein [Pseudomonas sp. LBUM920]
MRTSGLFFQFMLALKDFLPVIRRRFGHFEHESLPIRFLPARCAQATRNAATVFKMPPAQ